MICVPVLHHFSLPAGSLVNSDIVTDIRKELEGSEIIGMGASVTIFQNLLMGDQGCSQTPL